jgi:hypothetical protein
MQHTQSNLPSETVSIARGFYWRSRWSYGKRAVLVGGVIVGLCACSSPEVVRTRGGGPGADVGNRSAVVQLHAGAQPYYETPCRMTIECPDMER